MSLAEFYSTNYSKCNLTYSFLVSWQGVAYPSHIIQVFALPIQMLTFYILWKKTPINMKMMKWPLLINHACCCWLDTLFCSLATPYIFFHNFAYLGVSLFGWLKLSITFKILLEVESALFVVASYLYVFEKRSSSIQGNKFRIQKTWIRIIYHGGVHLMNSCFLLLAFQIPQDQEAAKLESLKIEPCPTVEFFRNEVIVILSDPFQIRMTKLVYAPAVVLNALFHILFHVLCTIYYLYIAPAKSISIETRKSQQRFFVAVILQTMIPFLLLITVFLAAIIDEITGVRTQKMINFIVIQFGFQGIVESFAVIMAHRPYRKAFWKMVKRRKAREVQDIHRVDGIQKQEGSN